MNRYKKNRGGIYRPGVFIFAMLQKSAGSKYKHSNPKRSESDARTSEARPGRNGADARKHSIAFIRPRFAGSGYAKRAHRAFFACLPLVPMVRDCKNPLVRVDQSKRKKRRESDARTSEALAKIWSPRVGRRLPPSAPYF